LLIIPSCGEEWINYCVEMDRQEGPVPYESIEEISNDSLEIWLQVIDTALYFEPVLYRIDDQIAFDTLVQCNCDDVMINFDDYTLLIGYFFIHQGPGEISQKYVKLFCGFEEQSLTYTIIVEIFEDIPNSLMPFQHHVFVPKLPDGIPIGHYIDLDRLYD
jgi:hypothetical protein